MSAATFSFHSPWTWDPHGPHGPLTYVTAIDHERGAITVGSLPPPPLPKRPLRPFAYIGAWQHARRSLRGRTDGQ